MEVAMPFGAYRPAVSTPLSLRACIHQPTSEPFAESLDRLSGCFSSQHRQHPLRVEILDSKQPICRALARPAAGRRDRGQVRRGSSEVDLCRRRTAETLMRAEVRVVDEAVPTGPHCNAPYACPFLERCWPPLPDHHVSTLYRIRASKVIKLVADDIETLHDLPCSFATSGPARRQVPGSTPLLKCRNLLGTRRRAWRFTRTASVGDPCAGEALVLGELPGEDTWPGHWRIASLS